jgi:hypothetical protein
LLALVEVTTISLAASGRSSFVAAHPVSSVPAMSAAISILFAIGSVLPCERWSPREENTTLAVNAD